MATEHISLDAAATERKARLAKLASLKRKRPNAEATVASDLSSEQQFTDDTSATDRFISGRNYDSTTKAPKLGFEQQPGAQQETVEDEAERLTKDAAELAARDEAEAEKGLDLFKLQPKKPNWDLKRDLAEKTKILDVRTQNAIARLVRERIEKAKQEAQKKASKSDEGEELGVEGSTLVEAVHLREREAATEQYDEPEDIP